jgi:outer membrane protein TolC
MQAPQRWQGSKELVTASRPDDLALWWQALRDPLLNELVERALTGGLDVLSAAARLREARARYALAGAERYPSLGGSAQASRSRSSAEVSAGATRTLYQAGLDASWELDLFGGLRRGVEAASADYAASAAEVRGARVTLAAFSAA